MYWMDFSPVTQTTKGAHYCSIVSWRLTISLQKGKKWFLVAVSFQRFPQNPTSHCDASSAPAAECSNLSDDGGPTIPVAGFLYREMRISLSSRDGLWQKCDFLLGAQQGGGQGSSGGARLGEGAQQLPISRWSMYVASWNHGRPKLSSPDASMQAFGKEREMWEVRSSPWMISIARSPPPWPICTFLPPPSPSPPPLQLQVSIVPASQYPPYSSLWHLVTGS